jgi:hypothetical protein
MASALLVVSVIGAVNIAAVQATEKQNTETATPSEPLNTFSADSKEISIRGTFELAPDGTPIRVEGTWYLQDVPFGDFLLARNQQTASSIPVPPGRGSVRLDTVKRLLLFEACNYDTTQVPPLWDCAPWMEIPLEKIVVEVEEEPIE